MEEIYLEKVRLLASTDSPDRWLGPSPLLDLEDTKLRLRVQSLTQLCGSEREKVLAVYSFVKRMPFAKPFRMRVHTAREVLDLQRGDSTDKATLLVAMLRILGLPARMRYLSLRDEIFQGLVASMPHPTRPVVETFRNGRWIATDTYIFDAAYFGAARARLKERGWAFGFGLHLDGQTLWDGNLDAYVNGLPVDLDPMVLEDHGVFCDALEFFASPSYRERHAPLLRAVHWNIVAASMDRAIRELREEVPHGAGGP
jgi:transglutaminase-like putative cysteine protease